MSYDYDRRAAATPSLEEKVKHVLEKAHLTPVSQGFASNGAVGWVSFEQHMNSEQAKKDADHAATLLGHEGLKAKVEHLGMGKYRVKINT